MNGDLHIHTSYSDGELNEYEIINEVLNSDICEFAICDHDTLEGSIRVSALLKSDSHDLIFHSGVELTARYNNINMHLLVRDFEYDNQNIIYLVNKISILRNLKIERMVNLVKEVVSPEANTILTPRSWASIKVRRVCSVISFLLLVKVPSRSNTNNLYFIDVIG